MRCKITENNSYTQVFATKIAQKAKYLTLSVYFHYVNDHFAAEPRYVGHSAVTPRAEPIAEHTKADAAAKSHDNVRYILSKGLSMTAWQPYPPYFGGRKSKILCRACGSCCKLYLSPCAARRNLNYLNYFYC